MPHEVARAAPEPLQAWQGVAIGSGLDLHGAVNIACDHAALAAEFCQLDAELGNEGRHFFGSSDGSWVTIPLLSADQEGTILTTAALERVPAAAHFISLLPGGLRRAHFMRQRPGGILDWHYDSQAIHQRETRILLPVHAPPEAYTLLGHLAVAYPEGQAWTGDFSFPHKVVNPGSRERIVLVIDVDSSPALAAVLPSGLMENVPLRRRLAETACSIFLEQRAA